MNEDRVIEASFDYMITTFPFDTESGERSRQGFISGVQWAIENQKKENEDER